MIKLNTILLFIFLFILLVPYNAFALTLDSTYVLSDTFFESLYPTANYSLVLSWQLKERVGGFTQAYFQFDISSIPSNVTIINAYVSAWQLYSRTGTFYVLAYNTTNNWNQNNITNGSIANGVLQSNTSTDFTYSSDTVGRKNWTVTNAVKSAYERSVGIVSITLLPNEASSSVLKWGDFASKEYGIKGENLVIEYNITDCSLTCGNCGCNNDSSACYIQPIVGSYCAIEDGMPDTIKTTNSNCDTPTYFNCSSYGSSSHCTQLTPTYNFSYDFSPQNATFYCAGCFFINIPNIHGYYVPFMSNCWDKPSCNCNDIYCANMYTTNDPASITLNYVPVWTAGCIDTINGNLFTAINETGGNTTFSDIITTYCANCTVNNTLPMQSNTTNTTTTCYNSYGIQIPCVTNSVNTLSAWVNLSFGTPYATNIIAFITSVGASMFLFIKVKSKKIETFIVPFLVFLCGFSLPGVEFFPLWIWLLLTISTGILIFWKAKSG